MHDTNQDNEGDVILEHCHSSSNEEDNLEPYKPMLHERVDVDADCGEDIGCSFG